MATVILWLLAAVAVLLIAVVSLPVRIRLLARSKPRQRLQVDVTPFGGFAPSIPVVDSQRKKSKPKPKRVKKKKKKKKKKWSHLATRKTSWRSRWMRGLPALIIEFVRKFKIHHLAAEGQFGFEDPADTGFVFGLMSPLIYGVQPFSTTHLNVRPVFGKACLSGQIDIAVEVTPAALIPPVLQFAWRRFGPK